MRVRLPVRARGFTLIEVLMALTIVAIALAAIVRASSLTITNLGLVDQQSLAMLSAQNRLAEVRLAQAALVPGVLRSACPQGGLRMVCRLETAPAVDGLRSVTVDVYLANDAGDTEGVGKADSTVARRLASLQTRMPQEPR